MEGSEIRESHVDGDTRMQDLYCIRCQPQVTGAAMDLLHFAARTLEIEANAVTDNPLVLVGDDLIVSGGNFHGEPVGFAADQIAVAEFEIGATAQRRVALMVDPTLSFDLPPFLTPDPGLNSGLMIAELTTAALMCENKHLTNPCTTDSTSTSANQEGHVSMAAHAVRRLLRMNANLNVILGVEAKPVGVFNTHQDAPRVLIANSNLVPHWATWDHFNELDKRGLATYGQMTAGSWIYIGPQSIVQGTYQTFMEAGRQHYVGNLKGRWILTGELGGMGGAQPLAAVMRGACRLAAECDETRADFRLCTRYIDEKTHSLDEALAMTDRWTKAGKAKSVALIGNAADVFPALV